MSCCPYCGYPHTWRCGRHRGQARRQRRRCPACDRTFTEGPIIGHRPPLGERAMTPAERMRRYRQRKKQKQGGNHEAYTPQ